MSNEIKELKDAEQADKRPTTARTWPGFPAGADRHRCGLLLNNFTNFHLNNWWACSSSSRLCHIGQLLARLTRRGA
jgi:hypothetical protein